MIIITIGVIILWVAGNYQIFDSFGNQFSLSGDHTETVEIHFDPKKTSYKEMLRMFWENHDPTRCASRQYMSAIFYHGDEQRKLAEESRDARQKQLTKKIVTKITPAETFYDAEEWVGFLLSIKKSFGNFEFIYLQQEYTLAYSKAIFVWKPNLGWAWSSLSSSSSLLYILQT